MYRRYRRVDYDRITCNLADNALHPGGHDRLLRIALMNSPKYGAVCSYQVNVQPTCSKTAWTGLTGGTYGVVGSTFGQPQARRNSMVQRGPALLHSVGCGSDAAERGGTLHMGCVLFFAGGGARGPPGDLVGFSRSDRRNDSGPPKDWFHDVA